MHTNCGIQTVRRGLRHDRMKEQFKLTESFSDFRG